MHIYKCCVFSIKSSIFQSNACLPQNWIWGTWRMSIFFKPSGGF